ncbi:ATP-dependent DNA helicase RecG [Tamaricihabitans halophyticus]|uniref:ATP-dependent DNA helicase RecG n=1 Tax=Tamaricihabitans halophyticus TaxID=1262583 RepID=A0A4R2QQY6_9PSEU|nr:ATP-dependent DNA helicase RecG [Tamaricihabitans halophyticus]TCP52027.1 ATP-dependent DNA helicase RecG [Tamaricihabitans halophyticus]
MAGLDDKLEPLVGAKSARLLESSLNVSTVGDLLRHYPRRYAQRGELTKIAGLEIGEHVTVLAEVREVKQRDMVRRRGKLTELQITDGERTLSCVFFKFVKGLTQLTVGKQALFAGKVGYYQNRLQLAHPEFMLLEDDEAGANSAEDFANALIPVYPASKDVQSWSVWNCVKQVLPVWDGATDPLPEELRTRLGLPEFSQALHEIHQPADWAQVEHARERLKWDEALAVQLVLASRKQNTQTAPAPNCPAKPDGLLHAFDQRLPFELTEGQREVGETIATELAGSHPMNRLLQGEVGSGKTMVALRAMLQVVDSGRQAAMLAPTEVLAAQHARSLAELLGDLAMAGELGGAEQATRVALLTGSLSAAKRKQAMLDVASGAAGIVVGTHALIQDKVSFADLGMAVVDEQHRFGVEQRDALRTRAADGGSPHVLVMTATPIPRTVAMTVYGDLETSALRQLPAGRSPISTSVVPASEKPAWLDRAWQRVREEVDAGHQAYVVCPRIGVDEDAADAEGVPEAIDQEESKGRPPLAVAEVGPMLAEGPLAGLRIGVLHGRLPTEEKDAVMRAFAAGDLDVLVATTVVEVGVNVPNATAMVIMDADRFGVSQLHQLRGRVGRGNAPGLCLLVTETLDGTSTRERLDAVASTVDGFELAQLDLELRREGDILGASQSGRRSGLKMLSLLRDEDVIHRARTEAQRIVRDDPGLAAHPGLAGLAAHLADDERADFLEKV